STQSKIGRKTGGEFLDNGCPGVSENQSPIRNLQSPGMLRHRAACYGAMLACPISVLPSRLTQECYGAGRLVTARCYGVDSENHQCFRALLRCYGVRPQGGGGPKLCRKLCRSPL